MKQHHSDFSHVVNSSYSPSPYTHTVAHNAAKYSTRSKRPTQSLSWTVQQQKTASESPIPSTFIFRGL